MTFSIIARDELTGRIGMAVASKFFAVGARALSIKSGVGGIVSQALFNPYNGPRGLALLAAGASASDAARLLTVTDDGRERRQLLVLDRDGRFAAHTGSQCPSWSGHILRETYAVAGNILASADVLDAMIDSYDANFAMPFARRLIAAMQAGDSRPPCSFTTRRTTPCSTCVLMITPTRLPSWPGLKPSRAAPGCTSGACCPVRRNHTAYSTRRISMPGLRPRRPRTTSRHVAAGDLAPHPLPAETRNIADPWQHSTL
jgi:hypothetical protein